MFSSLRTLFQSDHSASKIIPQEMLGIFSPSRLEVHPNKQEKLGVSLCCTAVQMEFIKEDIKHEDTEEQKGWCPFTILHC